MKALASILFVVLMSFPTVAFAQADAQLTSAALAPTEAEESFETMKTLAGEWEGTITVAEMPELVMPVHLTIRVTSRGHVIVHEFQEADTPLDPTKYDHPVTMLYVDEDADRLTLVHYCDAGNRPRMTGTRSADGKTFAFEFVDISGSIEYHMHNSVFNIIDADHHTEDWTFMMGDKPMHAHFDLTRTESREDWTAVAPGGN
ncbi:MAG TPA: hypothetical protein VEY33_00770 [Gemmatimonadota bacterium]|nr:hypothetical protein [Gemmatimonadota bacterium]